VSIILLQCPGGGIGIRGRLRTCALLGMRVRVPPGAPALWDAKSSGGLLSFCVLGAASLLTRFASCWIKLLPSSLRQDFGEPFGYTQDGLSRAA
jgi:hypothetical protein